MLPVGLELLRDDLSHFALNYSVAISSSIDRQLLVCISLANNRDRTRDGALPTMAKRGTSDFGAGVTP